ncbi:MAG: hypothetical protein ACYTKD_21395, partial [Planctomycetota bacterium]
MLPQPVPHLCFGEVAWLARALGLLDCRVRPRHSDPDKLRVVGDQQDLDGEEVSDGREARHRSPGERLPAAARDLVLLLVPARLFELEQPYAGEVGRRAGHLMLRVVGSLSLQLKSRGAAIGRGPRRSRLNMPDLDATRHITVCLFPRRIGPAHGAGSFPPC